MKEIVTERSVDEFGNVIKVRNEFGEMEYVDENQKPETIKERLGHGPDISQIKKKEPLPSDYRLI